MDWEKIQSRSRGTKQGPPRPRLLVLLGNEFLAGRAKIIVLNMKEAIVYPP